jgi:acylphosphatase
MSDTVAVRVEIRGRVQGVWYRAWTVQEASARALRGWVRNRRDGSVEALFAGPKDKVEAMIEACRTGETPARPPLVDSVQRFTARDDGMAGFEQRPTE